MWDPEVLSFICPLTDLSLMDEVVEEESRYELTPFLVSYIEASIDTITKETYLKHICHFYLKILINSY